MGKNLITGGHGFLGYYLAKLLLEEGEEVVLFDVVSESRFTEGIKDRVKAVRGDLRNWVQVLDVVRIMISVVYSMPELCYRLLPSNLPQQLMP